MMGLLLSIPLTILRYTYHLVAFLLFRRYVFLFVTLPCSVALYRRYQSYLAELAEEERRRSLGMDQNGWVSGGAYVPHRTRIGADESDGEGEVSTAAVTATTNGGLEAMRRRQQERLRQEEASASTNATSGSVLSGASSPAAAAIAGTASHSMALGRPGATPGVGLRRRKFASPPTSSGRSPLLATAAVAPAAASSAKRRRTDNDGNNDDSDGGVGEPLEQLWKRTRQGIDMATTVVSTVLEAGKRKFATAEAEEGREKRLPRRPWRKTVLVALPVALLLLPRNRPRNVQPSIAMHPVVRLPDLPELDPRANQGDPRKRIPSVLVVMAVGAIPVPSVVCRLGRRVPRSGTTASRPRPPSLWVRPTVALLVLVMQLLPSLSLLLPL